MLGKKHPELKEAVSCVKKMSLGEQWREVMLYRQMSKWKEWGEKEQIRLDLEAARAKGVVAGRAEGRVEGQEEKALEIAKKLKKAGFPVSEIAEFTGFSAETIHEIQIFSWSEI